MSRSGEVGWAATILRWQRRRLPLVFFVPLACLLSATALLVFELPPDFRSEEGVALVWLSFTFLAQLRLLDDLADRTRDQREHASRWLGRAPSLRPFQILWLLLFGHSCWLLALRVDGRQALAEFVALNLALAAWYALRDTLSPGSKLVTVNVHLVALKYPVLVGILAPGSEGGAARAVLLLLLVYLSVCITDLLDDERLCRNRWSFPLLSLEGFLWGATSLALAVVDPCREAPLFHFACWAAASAALGCLLWRRRSVGILPHARHSMMAAAGSQLAVVGWG